MCFPVFIMGTWIGGWLYLALVEGCLQHKRWYDALALRKRMFHTGLSIVKDAVWQGKPLQIEQKEACEYFGIQGLDGMLAWCLYVHYGSGCQWMVAFCLFHILLVLSYVDMKTMEIPNVLNAVVFCLCTLLFFLEERSLLSALLGVVIAAFPMLFINLWKHDSFGGGDIKLMSAFGVLGSSRVLFAFWIAVCSAGIRSCFLLLVHRNKKVRYIAFGPHLSFGIVVSLLAGEQIVAGYLSLL